MRLQLRRSVLLCAVLPVTLACLSCVERAGEADLQGQVGEREDSNSMVASPPSELPSFDAQEGWSREAQTGEFRAHQFKLPGVEGSDHGVVVVASWPRGVGPREANLDRWLTQMGVDGTAAALEPPQRTEEEVRHFMLTTLHLEGSYTPVNATGPAENQALIASWIEIPGESHVWTVKASGPKPTIDHWKDSVLAFLRDI